MPTINSSNFSSTIDTYVSYIDDTIVPNFTSTITNTDTILETDHLTTDGRAALTSIRLKCISARDNYMAPAKYYLQECRNAASAKYLKTATELDKYVMRMLRHVMYTMLPYSTIAPTNYGTTWFRNDALGATGSKDLWDSTVNMYNTSNANGSYYKIAQIVTSQTGLSDLENFFVLGGLGTGGTLNVDIPSAISNTAYTTMASEAYKTLTSVSNSGVTILKRFINDALNRLNISSSSEYAFQKVAYSDVLTYAINEANSLVTATSNASSSIMAYKNKQNIKSSSDEYKVLTVIQGSIESAESLNRSIFSRVSSINSQNDDSTTIPQRSWMSAHFASTISEEIATRLINAERYVDAIKEISNINNYNSTKSLLTSINNSLSTITKKLTTFDENVSKLTETDNQLKLQLTNLKNDLRDAHIANGELVLDVTDNESVQNSPYINPRTNVDLSTYVQTIRQAIYGKDMRAAIADAFEIIGTVLNIQYLNAVVLDTYAEWEALSNSDKDNPYYLYFVGNDLIVYKRKKYPLGGYSSESALGIAYPVQNAIITNVSNIAQNNEYSISETTLGGD